MNTWLWIGAAIAIAYATKAVGYVVPRGLLERPVVARATTTMTIGLLAALVVSNTFASGSKLTVDARVVALLAAALALKLRAPFIVVVIVGALAAGLARLAGMP